MIVLEKTSLFVLDPNPAGNPAVLLIHGLGADSESWILQFPGLIAVGTRPLAVDLPGFGKSKFPVNVDWTVPWVAAQVANWLRENANQTVIVVGLSMGGVIAQQLVLDYPEQFQGMVLASTFSRLRPRRWNELMYLSARFAIANLRGVKSQAYSVAWRVFPHPDQRDLRELLVQKIREADPRAYQSAMRNLAFFNARKRLREVKVPTLVISGAQDTTVSLENQLDLLRDIPGAKYVLIESANHAVNIDQPEAFDRVLLDFINTCSKY